MTRKSENDTRGIFLTDITLARNTIILQELILRISLYVFGCFSKQALCVLVV